MTVALLVATLPASGCSVFSDDGPLEVRAGVGGFAFAEPREPKDAWWASFSFPVCTHGEPAEVLSATVDEVVAPLDVEYRLISYDAVRVRKGQTVTRGGFVRARPMTARRQGRDHVGWPGDDPEDMVGGTVEPLAGAVVEHSCDSSRELGAAEHYVVVSARVSPEGTAMQSLRLTYKVDGDQHTTEGTEWQMTACGDVVSEESVCARL